MNSISNKRILKDINDLDKNNINSHGIYYYLDEDDIHNIKVLMIGPEKTPYEYGYYFFDIKIQDDYPFSPPKVFYRTQNNKTRFNPNLYVNGKVCLSIINTWSGPQWTSCNSITTVLLSIQAIVFVENPLHNEPGFEKENSVRNKNYNDLILFENFRTAIYKMIINTPPSFDYFNSIMLKTFIENYTNIIKKIDMNINKNNKIVTFDLFHMKEKLEYDVVKTLITDLHKSIIADNNI